MSLDINKVRQQVQSGAARPVPKDSAEVRTVTAGSTAQPEVSGLGGMLLFFLCLCLAGAIILAMSQPKPSRPTPASSTAYAAAATAVPFEAPTAASLGTVTQPSFDCGQAARWAEHQICASPDLSDADREMAALYWNLMAGVGGAAQDDLRQSQRRWLRERNGCEAAASGSGCLTETYRRRVAVLRDWQW